MPKDRRPAAVVVSMALAEPVEFPDDEDISLAQRLQACLQSGTFIRSPGRLVRVEPVLADACGDQGIMLQVERLRLFGSTLCNPQFWC